MGAIDLPLHAKYDAQWKGPWVGLELDGSMRKFLGHIRFEYHFPDYYAQAEWNLRTEFQHEKSPHLHRLLDERNAKRFR